MKKLTEADVLDIVESAKTQSQKALAEKYNVTQSLISQILGGHLWDKVTKIEIEPPDPPEEKFWNNVDKRGPNECWPWKAYIDPLGYPQYSWNGKLTTAYRVSKELEEGEPVPDNMNAVHTCGNKSCVNPKHIVITKHTQPTLDKLRK